MSLDVMKQALEALDSDNPDVQLRAAIALRAAIEQAQEPVACNNCKEWEKVCDQHLRHIKKLKKSRACQWQGLTDEEITAIACIPAAIPGSYVASFARAIEAKLKEKNT